MIIDFLEISNFRKFRDPLRIDGFTNGLNIVVEPNETGKSTLLEALRAALFVRHSANTELVRSYVPIGDSVAPRVSVGFSAKGTSWTLEKQFVRSPFARLSGAGSRRESDAAEEALQELLGFERGNNRGSDPETRGPLGLLWVEQASALAVEGPNRLVRDSVRGVLEAEVGAVTGGRRFEAIRAKVETDYGALRTSTGRSRGALAAAEARIVETAEARQQAETSFREYEQALSELEAARARLRIVQRDLDDPEQAEQRRSLEENLRTAETAALRAAGAEAEHGRADEIAKTAATRIEQLDSAERRVSTADEARGAKSSACGVAKGAYDEAAVEERDLRGVHEGARSEREAREEALTAARGRARDFAAASGARRAIEARNALAALEEREGVLVSEAAEAIDAGRLDRILTLERAELEARARFEAGTVKVEFDLSDGFALRVDGEESQASTFDLVGPTRFDIGSAGGLVVRPPAGSGRSLEADLAASNDALAAALRELGIASHTAGVARNERAAAAARELHALRLQIAVACPGDPTIGLDAGADALRAFVADIGDEIPVGAAPDDDIDGLERALTEARLAEVSAAGRYDESRAALSKCETAAAAANAELASAEREVEAAAAQLRTALSHGERAALEETLAEAQRDRAARAEALETARANASAFDVDTLRRRIANLDRAASQAESERLDLTGRVAALEATIARAGPTGPAGRLAEALEDEQAATAARDRLVLEADTLGMLRTALADAASEASRTFLAPVTRRAATYVQQLLPGCEITFDDELGLASVTRSGIDESCGDLSRGTQEQLAILTRLAFADLLLEDGAPISLILDDPLVYSDDVRLEVMTNMLQEASKRMQVILLTCRSHAFRHVEANRIALA
ncbi:AAA family ATPase [Sphingomonas pruni]|uniref:AAA family ATPase n=1 Tax=Sphingomonas pruni TaxID=40683 RepID=UPI000830BF01|nr:AAA family ATPase [Sphingomonas pruni]